MCECDLDVYYKGTLSFYQQTTSSLKGDLISSKYEMRGGGGIKIENGITEL